MAGYKSLVKFQISLFIVLSSSSLPVFPGRVPQPDESGGFRIQAVSLGGWLVAEGWIKPSLFDGIPNKDLLDGTKLRLKSVYVDKYLSAGNGGGAIVSANKKTASNWETFRLWRINESLFNFRVFNKQFVGLDSGSSKLVSTETTPRRRETFEIVRKPDDLNRVRIKASNGFFLQVKMEGFVTADFQVKNSSWGDDDPSVFLIKFKGKRLKGEYQVTNGYGPLKAPQIMKLFVGNREKESVKSELGQREYVTEDDFEFMAKNGLNTVRIPVGWWIASDPNPPKPFVAGSLQALDNAFIWARVHDLKVIIDLHCAPGSQNGWEHSGTRDGYQEWGLTNETIRQTVAAIDFLAARYANHPNLIGIELLNEPLSPGTSLQNVTMFYEAGYEAVRKYSSTAYVIMSNRLGHPNSTELFPLATSFTNVVIDVHFYNIFDKMFYSFSVGQNLDYIRNNRSAQIAEITRPNGPLVLVGEWVAEWRVQNASKRDYQMYAATQLKVYGQATFGWSYWCLKNAKKHWSLEWNIKKGYMKAEAIGSSLSM